MSGPFNPNSEKVDKAPIPLPPLAGVSPSRQTESQARSEAQPPPSRADASAAGERTRLRRQKQGRASTILTGGEGVKGQAPTARKSLGGIS